MIKLRGLSAALIRNSLGASIIISRLKKQLRDRNGRLSLVRYLMRDASVSGATTWSAIEKATNLRERDWRLEV